MSSITVRPAVVRGEVTAPPSKSYTHRALCAAFLSRRRFEVRNPLVSDDTLTTLRGLRALGARVTRSRVAWTVEASVAPPSRPVTIDCGESGTSLRFLSAVASLFPTTTQFTGSPRLSQRPMRALLEALEQAGVVVVPPPAGASLPFRVRGPLEGGRISVRAGESSQFLSALLLALPFAKRSSRVELVGPLVSRTYVEATESVLRSLGVRISRHGRVFRIEGNQRVRGRSFRVTGDASSAAYLWAAAAITGGRVRVRGISRRWPQADLKVLELLRRAGVAVEEGVSTITVSGRIDRPFHAELTDAPDLYPLAGVLAASVPRGVSTLRGAGHVVAKESDRRTGTRAILRALGARSAWDRRRMSLSIRGVARLRPLRCSGLTDHRLVMAAAVAALAAPRPSSLSDASAVRKSYPGFWKDLAALCGRAEVPP